MSVDRSFRPQVTALLTSILIAVVGLLTGVVASLTFIIGIRGFGINLGITATLVVTLILTQGLAFGGVALGYLRIRGRGISWIPIRVPSVTEVKWVVFGYVLALAGAIAGAILTVVMEVSAAPNQVGEIAIQNPEILLLLIPFSFLLIGPGEELLFRGIIQGSLREVFGPVSAIILASALFAAVHFVALTGGIGSRFVTIGILFLPSLVFGAAYERTKNLVVPAAIHGAYNATLFGLVYMALRLSQNAPSPPG